YSPEISSPSDSKGDSLRRERIYLVVAAAIAAVLRLPAYFASRHLTFDDGVFASSVMAMRDGGLPFRDIFSSQAPLFLPLAYVGDVLGLRTLNSPRVLAVISGVAITIFVFAALARVTSSHAALYGALLVGTSGCVMWVTGPLAADGPALAFAAVAFWLLLIYLDRPTLTCSLFIGLSIGASLSTKTMNLPLVVVAALVLLTTFVNDARAKRFDPRSLLNPLLSGLTAIAVFVLSSIPFGLADVWSQSFDYRVETSGDRDPLRNLRKIISTLWDRDLVLWLAVLVGVAWAIYQTVTKESPESEPVESETSVSDWAPSPRLLAVLWLMLTLVWLTVGVNPMWRAHVSAVVLPAALVLALYAPPKKWLAVVALASIPLLAIQLSELLRPGPYRGSEHDVVEVLRSLPEGAWAISDEPGLVWKAGLRTTDFFVDPSVLRIQTGRYGLDDVVSAAAQDKVCAVVVRSKDRFGSFPDLGQRLISMGYVVAQTSSTRSGDDQRVYVKADCSPTG
ncbi:MAG: glycosyltransferase family 39 protein, partial [Microthrixaceae bacterium]|nr:glycosyltransferase family 39 protein [Microthrixaceae bacterium]